MKAFVLTLIASLALWNNSTTVSAATITNFFTKFEPGEGYSTVPDLIGQAGWIGNGSGGNGILNEFIAGEGQQAYIGYAAPDFADDSLVIWQPLTNNTIAAYPIVKFSVLMNIQDSQQGWWDIFRWSVYNIQGDRLFSIDFDNDYRDVSYLLDGTNQVFFTGLPFENYSNYTLNVTMNFASNRWSATYNNILITTNEQPITTANAQLTLGDIDAVWLVHQITYTNGLGQVITTNAPGDNYMLFDNYRITSETLPVAPVTPAQVQFRSRTSEGWVWLRVFGDNNSRWALDATTNLVNWTVVETNVISGTYANVIDEGATGLARRFYRARYVP